VKGEKELGKMIKCQCGSGEEFEAGNGNKWASQKCAERNQK